MKEFKFHDALAAIWSAIAVGDRYVNDKKVWEIKDEDERQAALFNLVTLLMAVATILVPFMPETARKIQSTISSEKDGLKVQKIGILFPRI